MESNILKLFLILITIATFLFGYKPIFLPIKYNNGDFVAIREFDNKYLIVDIDRLNTYIVSKNDTSSSKLVNNSKYLKLLKKKIFKNGQNNYYLTADLCPSLKSLDIKFLKNINHPISIAITGKWIEKHQDDFELLKKQVNITWINHSYEHRYTKNLPNHKNFLLSENTNFDEEIFELERLLIKNGITPTIFFRFPGLVYNQELLDRLNLLGLIAIDSNAWLAKNEIPQNGSFILIHINGNEPNGLEIFEERYKNLNFKNLNEAF
jgi:hypothetical protein